MGLADFNGNIALPSTGENKIGTATISLHRHQASGAAARPGALPKLRCKDPGSARSDLRVRSLGRGRKQVAFPRSSQSVCHPGPGSVSGINSGRGPGLQTAGVPSAGVSLNGAGQDREVDGLYGTLELLFLAGVGARITE